LILIDSTGWIESLAARPLANAFAPYIDGVEPLVNSVIQVYEICKVIRRDISEERAVESVAALHATTIEPLTESLALETADLSLDLGLAMADAIIFATAVRRRAALVTADADFDGLPGVTLIRK